MRSDEPGAVHHVMNRGVDRQAVFFDDRDRIEFGARLAEAHERFGLDVLAYCLMTTHYHLLVRTGTESLSDAMHHIGSVYTRRTNDRVGRDGPLFRGRFHAIRVDTDWYLKCAARYIHRNPLAIRGVDDPAAYRWSSLRTYEAFRAAPPFLATDLLLGLHDGDVDELAAFTREPDREASPTDAADLRTLIHFEVARDDIEHGSDDQAQRWIARTVERLVVAALPPGPLRDSLVPHDAPSSPADTKALARARARADDPVIARITQSVLANLRPV